MKRTEIDQTNAQQYMEGGEALASWLRDAGRHWPLVKGSLSEVRKTCSVANCKVCKSGKKHRSYLFNYRIDGKTHCIYVPLVAVDTVRQALENGRKMERRMVEEGVQLIQSFHAMRTGPKSRKAQRSSVRTCVGILSELDVFSPDGGYYRDLSGQLMQVLRVRGLDPILFNGTVQPSKEDGQGGDVVTCPEFWTSVSSRRIDAAVFICVPSSAPWMERVRTMKIPAVGAPTRYAIEHSACVIDPGLRELKQQGAKKVALLAWDRGKPLELFQAGVQAFGLETRPEWVAGAYNPDLPGSGWEALREIWSACREKPDGLLVSDDVLFHGAARSIVELGIAERLKIVTAANRTCTQVLPQFAHTRFEFDPRRDAESLADLLEARLLGQPPPAGALAQPFEVVHVNASAAEMEPHPAVSLPGVPA